MQKYKITVLKNHKKYTIVIDSDNQRTAKEKIHKEGYTILNVEEINESEISGNKYIFRALLDGKQKTGKVVGNDIFKVYIKLKNGFGYDIIELYSENDKDLDLKSKSKIVYDLEDQYKYYMKNNTHKETVIKKEKPKNNNINSNDKFLDNFYLKKDLDETYNLISLVLEKLNNIITGEEKINLDDYKREKLGSIYNNITKLKKSTNMAKLKQIGELALIKIGDLELESLEKNKSKFGEKLLGDTNSLLKKIGSNKHFVEKDKDIGYQFLNMLKSMSSFFSSGDNKNISTNKGIDKKSYSYLKSNVLLSKYKLRLKDSNKEILKNIVVFLSPFGKNKEIKNDILIKRNVIKQNIKLLKVKNRGLKFSYTKIKKGYISFIDNIYEILDYLNSKIFFIILIFSAIFILFLNLKYFLSFNTYINYNGILYFIYVLLGYIFILLSRGLISFIINFVFLYFIIIFLVVNF